MKTVALDTEEIWKSVFNYNGYEISNFGRVRNNLNTRGILKNKPHMLKYYLTVNGMLQVDLYKKYLRRKVSIHTLVLETFFIGPKQFKVECAHLDGNATNNKFINLKWATHKENEGHKRLHGTMRLGENRYGAKLDNDKVVQIRSLYRQGWLQKDLAIKFEVSISIISRVINNRIWSHV